MIILDTCIMIFDALSPEKLTTAAKKAVTDAQKKKHLFCSDISLWEIAMLIQKKRLFVAVETKVFIDLILIARGIQVLPIDSTIAELSVQAKYFSHFDPADRLIAATTLAHKAILVTSDEKLRNIPELITVW